MSKDFCMDCGMLLSSKSNICKVCGLDNSENDYSDIALDINYLIDANDDFVQEIDLEF